MGLVCMWGAEGYTEISVSPSQFCCKLKIAIKKSSLKIYWNTRRNVTISIE